MINPYIQYAVKKPDLEPVTRDGEVEAIKEGDAVKRANGYRVRQKGRHEIKTKQREAA